MRAWTAGFMLASVATRAASGAVASRCGGACARAPALVRQCARALASGGSARGARGARGAAGGLGGAKIIVHGDRWTPPEPMSEGSPRVQTAEYNFFDDADDDNDDDDDVTGARAARGARRAAPRQPRAPDARPAALGATLDVQLGRCAGCGVTLQANEEGAPGFLPRAHLERSERVGHRVVCTRCHGLLHQNSADKEVRVGHSAREELSPRRFEQLLEACLLGHDARSPSGVVAPSSAGCGLIVYLVDLFDLEGSALHTLPELVGETPLILVGTKADTLPPGTSFPRIDKWLRTACRERLGALEPAEVHLISAATGRGVAALGAAVMRWAERVRDRGDVYVVGAANVGKSSLINALIDPSAGKRRRRPVGPKGGLAASADAPVDAHAADEAQGAEVVEEEAMGDGADDGTALDLAQARALAKASAPVLLTASHLPGTTLQPVRVRCRDGLVIYDTPGLVQAGQLATLLTPQEVSLLLPRAPVKPAQLSLGRGKCLLLGGLARVDVLESGFAQAVVLAAHVAPALTLHPTSLERADAVRAQHCGAMLTPPLGGAERLRALGDLETTDIEVEGVGFRRAAADIAIGGIGWLAVVGDGLIRLRVHAPKGVRVVPREPLNPNIDGTRGNARFTGTRVVAPREKRRGGGAGRGR
ncbi:hypothetical protein KFE25_005351 [Diacronema lutheri]|uniref:NOA1/YqeH-like C-terminal domain-containing protein n=2 Tax=Diacronema lutheri TaxID=2081491 RepID=A0A8J5XJP0_DIALT|nr:hypothetical protein KFE25_005351 [Diacronema lutheri]